MARKSLQSHLKKKNSKNRECDNKPQRNRRTRFGSVVVASCS